MSAMKTLIIDGSPAPSSSELVAWLAEGMDYIIAVDRGAATCRAAGLVPDLFVGDADSADPETVAWAKSVAHGEIDLPVEKDATDLWYALDAARKEAARRGEVCDLTLTCISGGRPDHALAIYGLLAENRDLYPVVSEDGFDLTILSPDGIDSWEFTEYEIGKTFSAIALMPGTSASSDGLRWCLDDVELPLIGDTGVSNVIVGPDAKVWCDEGCLAAFLIDPDRDPHPGLFDDSRFE